MKFDSTGMHIVILHKHIQIMFQAIKFSLRASISPESVADGIVAYIAGMKFDSTGMHIVILHKHIQIMFYLSLYYSLRCSSSS